jgi:hypothetical protein
LTVVFAFEDVRGAGSAAKLTPATVSAVTKATAHAKRMDFIRALLDGSLLEQK